jgi:catechol 2,3-dioxygenase-like lactoylglutathione lyase family enzyme
VIATVDLDRLVSFYAGLLGQDPHPHWPQRYAEFRLNGLTLGLFRPQASHTAEFESPQAGSLSLCLEVMDLDPAIAHLTRLGFPPPGPILTASHGREIYAYDPDGNRLILHQAPPSVHPPPGESP